MTEEIQNPADEPELPLAKPAPPQQDPAPEPVAEEPVHRIIPEPDQRFAYPQ